MPDPRRRRASGDTRPVIRPLQDAGLFINLCKFVVIMFIHYIKTIFRTLRKQKLNAVINILGLSLGLGITLLIWIFLLQELSYDRFFDDHHRIYRAHSTLRAGQVEPQTLPTTLFPLGETALREFPEVEGMTRLTPYYTSPAIIFEDQATTLQGILFADSNFFEIFKLPFLAGDPVRALVHPNTIVLNERTATRLTGDPLDAMHRTLTVQGQNYEITGIFEDLPENTHFQFNAISNHVNLPEQIKASGANFYTYLKLVPGADPKALEEKLDQAAAEFIRTNPLYEGLEFHVAHSLMQVSDIHLHSNLVWEMKDNGNWRNVVIFSLLSAFILFVAIINFVNLSTARSMLRSKEIGVRKMAGASRGMLIRQIMTESLLITLLSFMAAIVLTEVFSAYFADSLGTHLSLSAFFSLQGLLVMIVVFLITSILSGLYPAFYLSSFDPVTTLKGEVVKGSRGQVFRRVLVVFQFAITLFVISSLLAIGEQTRYMQTRDPGFDKEGVMILRNLPGRVWQSFPAARARLETIPRIVSAAGSNYIYGGNNRLDLIAEAGADKSAAGITVDVITVDHRFFEVMGLGLAEGRNFRDDSEMDVQSAFILNETAVNALGFEEPIGKQLDLFNIQGPLIGVVQDFNLKSMHQSIEPMAMIYAQTGFPHMYLRVMPGDFESLQADITEAMREFDPAFIPDILFLDDAISMLYQEERQTTRLLSAGGLLAFIISLLGVYGLAAFSAERRVKEMGIRIVLGASVTNLLWVFNRESVFLAGISMLIAWPLTWVFVNGWLDNFAYRVTINPLWFLLPGLAILLMSSLIISLQAWLTARENPVESLRSE